MPQSLVSQNKSVWFGRFSLSVFAMLVLPVRLASAELDLVNSPTDNLALEQLLISNLVSGNYQDALDAGLPHLDPFSMSLTNLRLLIRAARLQKKFDLAHELIGLARLIYPSDPSIELEDRLLYLAKGRCHDALRPIEKGGLTIGQAKILEQIHKQCPVEWAPVLHLSGWVSKPARSRSGITEVDPKDNSFIDQICTVFSVGCGPIAVNGAAEEHERAHLQAIWHLRHLRRDRVFENIYLHFQKSRALRGDAHGTQAFMQYGWQINSPRLSLYPHIIAGVRQDDTNQTNAQSQTVQAGALSVNVLVATRFSFVSTMRHTRTALDNGETRTNFQENGFVWRPSPQIHFSYNNSQATNTPPADDIRGPYNVESKNFGIAAQFRDRYRLHFKRAKRTEYFSRVLYYLTAPHQIIQQSKTIRLDLSFKKNRDIWIETEEVISRSADALYNFEDMRVAIGFKVSF